MKLILTDYIASLREEKELDSLLQDLLREFAFEIIYAPQKGQRQYGVDIYAVGPDPKDGIRKVFLVTVKQGNLDRKNWQGSIQALEPSLREIVTVFVRNNINPEHRDLPIKIIVAHNGTNDPAIQQNWVGFTEEYPRFEFDIWQLESIVNMVAEKMFDENVFWDESRMLLRKIIIYLFNPDYDFADYKTLIDEILAGKKTVKALRKINLLLTIIVSYCEKENDTRLALIACDITLLRLWKFLSEEDLLKNSDYFNEFFKSVVTRKSVSHTYLDKILPLCLVRDGFGVRSGDSINYTLIAYEHLGLIALAGLQFLQIAELYLNRDEELVELLHSNAMECATGIINLFNNNRILYNPRTDDHIIEINLALILLFRLGRTSDIRVLLIEFNNQLAHGKLFLNIFSEYHNNIDLIFNLGVNYAKRQEFKYNSSSLLSTLAEWSVVLDDNAVYDAYCILKSKVFSELDLTLWFPDKETEKLLCNRCALPASGYCLSNITLPQSFEEFKTITLRDHIYNCQEEEFVFIKEGFWILGLLASRLYRTYVFPFYWRQFIPTTCDVIQSC